MKMFRFSYARLSFSLSVRDSEVLKCDLRRENFVFVRRSNDEEREKYDLTPLIILHFVTAERVAH